MPLQFEYLSKVSICLAIIYLFYLLLLRKTTHYTWNRYFFLCFSVLSFIIPLINLDNFIHSDAVQAIPSWDQVSSLPKHALASDLSANSTFLELQDFILIVLLTGSITVFCRFLVQILSLKVLTSKASLLLDGDIKFYNLPGQILPFSFFNRIYLNRNLYSEEEFRDIVQHELVHVQQNHTIDILLTEFMCIINWFNPFTWLIKKAVRENLEFIADDLVIKKGMDKRAYQYLLVKVTGSKGSGIPNYLNFSSLKKRITMMNKAKSKKRHLFRFVLWVPIVLLLLLAFRYKGEKQGELPVYKDPSFSSFTLSSITYAVADHKVEAIVRKEREKSWLKVGETFDLSLVSYEKERLQNLLKKYGYDIMEKQAITFLIDTTSSRNNFSVQVNINVSQPETSMLNRSRDQPVKSLHAATNNREMDEARTGRNAALADLHMK